MPIFYRSTRVESYLSEHKAHPVSFCEHVEADNRKAVAIRSENDSYGPYKSTVLCAECDEETGKTVRFCINEE